MRPIKIFTKTSREVQDYDTNFNDWLSGLNDTGASMQVTPATGITLLTSSLMNGIAKVWLSGGVDKADYQILIKLTTTGARQKEEAILIKVRD